MKYLLFTVLVLTSCYCLQVDETIVDGPVAEDVTGYNREDFKTGGYTTHKPGPGDKPVDEFIKKNLPQL